MATANNNPALNNDFSPPPAGPGSSTLPASFGGPVPPGQTPPPSVNNQVVYTDSSGKGYNPQELQAAWGNGSSAFASDPLNARVRDILPQYGSVMGSPMTATPPPGQTYNSTLTAPTTPAATTPPTGASGTLGAGTAGAASSFLNPNPTASSTSNLAGSGQSQDLVNLLMQRAQQSLNIDPTTDSIIKPQIDAARANSDRMNRSYMSQAAERGGPNSNTDAIGRSLAENSAQGITGLQSQLTQNELTSRRQEIQNALSESGSMLTSQQQMSLQQELGLINAQLQQSQQGNQNDQFLATLGLNSENQSNYWDSLRQGLLG